MPARPVKSHFTLYPQRPETRDAGTVRGLGARAIRTVGLATGMFQTLFGALASMLKPGQAARNVCRRIAVRQVFYTGFEALPLVSVIAFLVGATLVLQMQLMAGKLHGELVGLIVVTVVLREVAPLTTAIVVAGRSGTAMATELGNMKVNDEILGLVSLGIDPLRFVVMPRLISTVISVLVLTVYFGAIAILSGYGCSLALGVASASTFRDGIGDALSLLDFPLFLVKGLGLGTLVGWVCCHFGLKVEGSPTEVPQQASFAVMMSLVASVAYNALVTAGFYWWAGPPVS